MSQNHTEIRSAVKLLLKRYDLVNAWKYVLPKWIVHLVFSLITATFILFLLLSAAAFSPEYAVIGDIPPRLKFYFLYFFSNNPLLIYLLIFSLVFIIRSIIQRKTLFFRRKKTWDSIEKEIVNTNYISRDFVLRREYAIIIIASVILLLIVTWKVFLICFALLIALVILPGRQKTFVFSIFLPRIIITIAYVWVTFIFTEENTRYFQALNNKTYALIFMIGIFGSAFFLFHEAMQNTPSIRKYELFMKRMLPVFAYSVFISILLGLIIEFSSNNNYLTKEKHATSVESYIFTDSLNIQNYRLTIHNSLLDLLNQIQNERQNLNEISIEAQLQKISDSYYYSLPYNQKLTSLKKNLVRFDSTMYEIIKRDTVIANDLDNGQYKSAGRLVHHSCIYCSENFKVLFPNQLIDTSYQGSLRRIATVAKIEIKKLNEQIEIAKINDSIIHHRIITGQSIINCHIRDILNKLNTFTDPELAKLKLLEYTGYKYFLISRDSVSLESTFRMYQNSLKEKGTLSNYYLSIYPVKVSKDHIVEINLKRFLIQVVIAVAIGVIGQLIIADKTVTEPL